MIDVGRAPAERRNDGQLYRENDTKRHFFGVTKKILHAYADCSLCNLAVSPMKVTSVGDITTPSRSALPERQTAMSSKMPGQTVYTIAVVIFALAACIDPQLDMEAEQPLEPIGELVVAPGDTFSALIVAAGNVDLYVSLDVIPTTDTYDCGGQSKRDTRCDMVIPDGISRVYIAVDGVPGAGYEVTLTHLPDKSAPIQRILSGEIPRASDDEAQQSVKAMSDKAVNGSFESFNSANQPSSWTSYYASSVYSDAQSGSYKLHFTKSHGYSRQYYTSPHFSPLRAL